MIISFLKRSTSNLPLLQSTFWHLIKPMTMDTHPPRLQVLRRLPSEQEAFGLSSQVSSSEPALQRLSMDGGGAQAAVQTKCTQLKVAPLRLVPITTSPGQQARDLSGRPRQRVEQSLSPSTEWHLPADLPATVPSARGLRRGAAAILPKHSHPPE